MIRKGAALLLLCGTALAAGPTVHDTMEEMAGLRNRMEENLLKGGSLEAWEKDGAALDADYAWLEGAHQPGFGGKEEGWRGFCRDSRAALAEALAARRAGDGAAARTAFFRLAEIREKAHGNFRPGLFKKLSRLFKRKEKRK